MDQPIIAEQFEITRLNLIQKENDAENPPDNKIEINKEDPLEKPNAREDLFNIIFIQALYILQTVPIGLLGSVPMILQSRKVTYADQGLLSFASWPLSLKILWAPLIDSIYFKKLGRRKTWIVSLELLLAIVSIGSANYVNNILDVDYTRKREDILMLTIIFGAFSLLAASHDTVLDGWAIELLLKKNLSWQATCNSIGFVVGAFMGNGLFLLLESAEFCNLYLRPLLKIEPSKYGFISIRDFFYVYGGLVLLSGVLVLFLKNEKNLTKLKNQTENERDEIKVFSVLQTYKFILDLISMEPIIKFIFILLTIRIGFSTENIVRLRLIDEGVTRERITILSLMLSPLMIFLPLILNKYLHGNKPFDLLLNTYGFKLITVAFYSFLIYAIPFMKNSDSTFPAYFYAIYLVINILNASFSFIAYISIGSFISKIADRSIGGTYMTFLSLWGGVGAIASRTIVLFMTSASTYKTCQFDQVVNKYLGDNIVETVGNYLNSNTCKDETQTLICKKYGGSCLITFDGFYLLSFIFIVIGFLWLVFSRSLVKELQSLPRSVWLVSTKIASK